MSAGVFVAAAAVFSVCLALHIIIWRFRIPRHDALALFIVFLVVPASVFCGLLILSAGMDITFWPAPDLVLVLLLHTALAGVYISSYPAAQAISPSLDIILMIAASPQGRLTEEEINQRYDDSVLVTARVEDLRRSHLVNVTFDHAELTRTGRVIIRGFIFYRRLLGLPLGEG